MRREKVKRNVLKAQFAFLKQELSYFAQEGVITAEQREAMLSQYGMKAGFHFIRALLVVGSLLVGAGILSFTAGNWNGLPLSVRFLLILLGLIGCYVAGWRTEAAYPKTARSLYYLGLFVYGAGIFLIGQMFHLDSHSGNAFLAWTLGAVPLALYLKDRWVLGFAIVLLAIYGYRSWDLNDPYPWALLLFIPLLYWINEAKMGKSQFIFFFNNLLSLLLLFITLTHLEVDINWSAVILLGVGVTLVLLPQGRYANVLQWQGSTFHGIGGIMLTFADCWTSLWRDVPHPEAVSVVFAIYYTGFTLYLLKRGSLPAMIIICGLIFRFYVDLSYDFLPKSLFFVMSGGWLIACGYWFEKTRRKEAS
jgi:uncharacterized membrane protein